MPLPPPLVPPCDEDHGCAVEKTACSDWCCDSRGGGRDWRAVAGIAAEGSAAALRTGGNGRRGGCSGGGAPVEGLSGEERDRGNDEAHERGDGGVRVAVEARVGSVDVDGQLVDHVGGDVEEAEGGDIAVQLGGVVRLDSVHYHLFQADAEAVGNALWREGKYLACGLWVRGDKDVVQLVLETDLDESRVLRLVWHTARGLDDFGHTRRDAGCAGRNSRRLDDDCSRHALGGLGVG